MPEFRIDGEVTLIDVLTNSGTVSSGSEVRRLLKQNGIKVDEEKVDDPYRSLEQAQLFKWETTFSKNCFRNKEKFVCYQGLQQQPF